MVTKPKQYEINYFQVAGECECTDMSDLFSMNIANYLLQNRKNITVNTRTGSLWGITYNQI